MEVLQSILNIQSKDYKLNSQQMKKVVNTWRDRVNLVKNGGGEAAVAKHKSRGKLTARERIELLIDNNSSFLEFSTLAAWEVYENQTPSAGIVTGIGVIHGQECVLISNDATVKGGTYFPITVKKHLRAQEIAMENRLPIIYLVDSAGVYLPMQDEIFADK